MLFGSITILSALGAALTLWLSGAWTTLHWLWVLPVSFCGYFLVLFLLAFGFLALICKLVDQEKPQERDSKFYRAAMYIYIEALISLVLVRLHTRGLENTPRDGRFLLVCNHLHLADPGILHHCFRKSQLAFISKEENKSMFVVGPMMHKTMCQLVNRENDRQALKTILRCIQLIKEDQVSIGVFPEGYTSMDGKLHHFRPGVFKIAQKAEVPIVVCTLRNTQNIFRNLPKLRHTDVEVRLVGIIPPEELKGVTATQISDRVYGMMISDLGEDYRPEA